jgi:hypothetical protein
VVLANVLTDVESRHGREVYARARSRRKRLSVLADLGNDNRANTAGNGTSKGVRTPGTAVRPGGGLPRTPAAGTAYVHTPGSTSRHTPIGPGPTSASRSNRQPAAAETAAATTAASVVVEATESAPVEAAGTVAGTAAPVAGTAAPVAGTAAPMAPASSEAEQGRTTTEGPAGGTKRQPSMGRSDKENAGANPAVGGRGLARTPVREADPYAGIADPFAKRPGTGMKPAAGREQQQQQQQQQQPRAGGMARTPVGKPQGNKQAMPGGGRGLARTPIAKPQGANNNNANANNNANNNNANNTKSTKSTPSAAVVVPEGPDPFAGVQNPFGSNKKGTMSMARGGGAANANGALARTPPEVLRQRREAQLAQQAQVEAEDRRIAALERAEEESRKREKAARIAEERDRIVRENAARNA